MNQALEEAVSRYSPQQRRIIEAYWAILRRTRKSGKIADSVLLKELAYWAKYPPNLVQRAIQIHIQRHHSKREAYTRGILRGLAVERRAVSAGTGTARRDTQGGRGTRYIDGSAGDGDLPI